VKAIDQAHMRKGRFSQPAAELAQRYGQSVSLDWRLYRHDIAGSIAHAAALARAGIITTDERRQIEKELPGIEKEIESGGFKLDRSLEDVHMNIEAALTKRIGVAGAKLHTARSRKRNARPKSSRDRSGLIPGEKGNAFSRGAPNRWRACCALHNENGSTGSNRHRGNEKVFTTLRR